MTAIEIDRETRPIGDDAAEELAAVEAWLKRARRNRS